MRPICTTRRVCRCRIVTLASGSPTMCDRSARHAGPEVGVAGVGSRQQSYPAPGSGVSLQIRHTQAGLEGCVRPICTTRRVCRCRIVTLASGSPTMCDRSARHAGREVGVAGVGSRQQSYPAPGCRVSLQIRHTHAGLEGSVRPICTTRRVCRCRFVTLTYFPATVCDQSARQGHGVHRTRDPRVRNTRHTLGTSPSPQ